MRIENNILIGDKIGLRENAISVDEYADEYEYITSFSGSYYLNEVLLNSRKKLTNYKELLLILCEQNDTVLNAMHISEWDINSMINNYEFTDGSFVLEKIKEDTLYSIAISVKSENKIYTTCKDNSKGYIFR